MAQHDGNRLAQHQEIRHELTDVEKNLLNNLINGKIGYSFTGAKFEALAKIKDRSINLKKLELAAIFSLLATDSKPDYKTVSLVVRIFNIDPTLFNPDNEFGIQSNMRTAAIAKKNMLKRLRIAFYKKNHNQFNKKSAKLAFGSLEKINTLDYRFLGRDCKKSNKSKDFPVIILDLEKDIKIKISLRTFTTEMYSLGIIKK